MSDYLEGKPYLKSRPVDYLDHLYESATKNFSKTKPHKIEELKRFPKGFSNDYEACPQCGKWKTIKSKICHRCIRKIKEQEIDPIKPELGKALNRKFLT